MTAPLPSQTITGTTAADIRSTTPGVAALVETFQAGDTITLNNDGDYALGGDGPDLIIVGGTASVDLQNSVVAGEGADTIRLNTAAAGLTQVGFSVAGNQGNDLISITAGGIFNNAFIGGGTDSDTINVQGVSQFLNSSIRGGENGDSISMLSGALINTFVEGNKGADTINVGFSASTNGSVGGGDGQDIINIQSASVVSWVNGGAGSDSIVIGVSSLVSTVAGGGLNDTIAITGGFGGGIIYGDAVGVTTSGTGTGGTADGNDLIGTTATVADLAVSIYGAGGNDTINLLEASTGILINGGDDADLIVLQNAVTGSTLVGGNGADTITLVTAVGPAILQGDAGQDSISVAAASALTITGGAGLDTIVFTNAAVTAASNVSGDDDADLIYVGTAAAASALTAFNGAGTVAGGNGADTIASLGFASVGSISGGADNDSIQMGTAAQLAYSANGTINGGAGIDTIQLAAGADAGTVFTGSNLTTGIASIVYQSGDVIKLAFTAGGTQAINGIINVGTSAGTVTGVTAAASGGLYVYSDGTDTFFAFNNDSAAAGEVVAFKVLGSDLVTTTAQNTTVAANTANFGFTLSGSASTGLTITLA